jgi:hypothetical protein
MMTKMTTNKILTLAIEGYFPMSKSQISTSPIEPNPSPKIDELVGDLIANLLHVDNSCGRDRMAFVKQSLRLTIKLESELVTYQRQLELQAKHLRQFDMVLPLKDAENPN